MSVFQSLVLPLHHQTRLVWWHACLGAGTIPALGGRWKLGRSEEMGGICEGNGVEWRGSGSEGIGREGGEGNGGGEGRGGEGRGGEGRGVEGSGGGKRKGGIWRGRERKERGVEGG